MSNSNTINVLLEFLINILQCFIITWKCFLNMKLRQNVKETYYIFICCLTRKLKSIFEVFDNIYLLSNLKKNPYDV